MIRRIDLFLPPISQYGVLHHFTKKFGEALVRLGVGCRILEAEKNNPKPFLTQIFADPPQCTLSFNGLLPDDEGRFFCDLIKIPHVACLVDSPNNFFPLIKSSFSIITCVDRFSCDFFKGLNFKNALFMPHAVEKNLAPSVDAVRNFEVLMLASCIDYNAIERSWAEKYPASLCEALHEAAEITFSDQETSYVQAFVQALDRQAAKNGNLDVAQIDMVMMLDELEIYIRGLDRIELIKSIKDSRIDIFGGNNSKALWEKYLGKKHPNVVLHDGVPFEQALELMKHAKIALNSCPWIKNGAHERVFAGLACGALVATAKNPYLEQQFKDGENILFYNYQNRSNLNDSINRMLMDEDLREKTARKGRDITMHNHTWDHRAATLLKELDPILKSISKGS